MFTVLNISFSSLSFVQLSVARLLIAVMCMVLIVRHFINVSRKILVDSCFSMSFVVFKLLATLACLISYCLDLKQLCSVIKCSLKYLREAPLPNNPTFQTEHFHIWHNHSESDSSWICIQPWVNCEYFKVTRNFEAQKIIKFYTLVATTCL